MSRSLVHFISYFLLLSLLPLLSLYGRLFLSVSSSLAYVVIPPIINDLIFADVNLRSSSDSSIDINGPPMGLYSPTQYTQGMQQEIGRIYISVFLYACMFAEATIPRDNEAYPLF